MRPQVWLSALRRRHPRLVAHQFWRSYLARFGLTWCPKCTLRCSYIHFCENGAKRSTPAYYGLLQPTKVYSTPNTVYSTPLRYGHKDCTEGVIYGQKLRRITKKNTSLARQEANLLLVLNIKQLKRNVVFVNFPIGSRRAKKFKRSKFYLSLLFPPNSISMQFTGLVLFV